MRRPAASMTNASRWRTSDGNGMGQQRCSRGGGFRGICVLLPELGRSDAATAVVTGAIGHGSAVAASHQTESCSKGPGRQSWLWCDRMTGREERLPRGSASASGSSTADGRPGRSEVAEWMSPLNYQQASTDGYGIGPPTSEAPAPLPLPIKCAPRAKPQPAGRPVARQPRDGSPARLQC
jgi:hypothetical protein